MRTVNPLTKLFIYLLLLAITTGICVNADADTQYSKTEYKFCDDTLLSRENERLNIKLFPVINQTDFQVWESKYYPYSILEKKINEYLASLFMSNPRIDAQILDSIEMNRWLASPGRSGDMAAQIEIYRASFKTRDNVLGNFDSNSIAMRIKIYDSINADKFADSPVHGNDKRYTFAPSEGQLFYLNAIISLPIPFADGLDLLGLTRTRYKGQRMSSPTWEQFNDTSAWQAFKNATEEAHKHIMMQIGNALTRNNRGLETASIHANSFSSSVGRIISPTANSTRRRREYIVSLGEMDSVTTGDILEVVRGDTYITVDPERPVVVVPKEIGRVRVKWVQAKEAIVTVTHENDKNDPIQLKDIVIKRYGRLGAPYGRNK